ncbi:hypothetical protein B0H34DRAFT_796679 [Crassisporium funariophilum]|nr:hypothetical protein B0H34DRAFT_796679 [Crassisporium funariophilum]
MASNRVGSVFLGDFQRLRHLSSSSHSTPPSSPPLTGSIYHSGALPHSPLLPIFSGGIDTDIDMDPSELPAVGSGRWKQSGNTMEHESAPGKIDPLIALELRLRWLEALILGVKQDLGKDKKGKAKEDYSSAAAAAANLKHGQTLTRLTETVQQKLNKAVEGNDGLKRFMDSYDQHAHLLVPSSGTTPDAPTYDNMSPEEIDAFLVEMEPDIRAADRDMREIEALENKGVTGAGKLLDHEKLQPRLAALLEAYNEDAKLAASLEERIASLVDRHATYVDALSELFVAWDDTITEAEDKLAIMERERTERLRLGLE